MDDKTIEGGILSSPLRKAGPGPLRESFGTILDPFMTAMISGPRYASTIELQLEADAPILRTKAIHTASQVIPHLEENIRASEATPCEIPDNVFSQWE
jgi:hypothetical protein